MGVYDFFGDFAFLGEYAVAAVMVFINMVFVLYDYTIRMIESVYVNWFRPTYFGKKKAKAAKQKKIIAEKGSQHLPVKLLFQLFLLSFFPAVRCRTGKCLSRLPPLFVSSPFLFSCQSAFP